MSLLMLRRVVLLYILFTYWCCSGASKDDDIRDLLLGDNIECVGMVSTQKCDPDGPRDEKIPIIPCSGVLENRDIAGYCLLRERDGSHPQKEYHVMKRSCHSYRGVPHMTVTCDLAIDFYNFRTEALAYRHHVPPRDDAIATFQPVVDNNEPLRGIVYNIYERAMISVYVSIKVLREVGCVLPIELWMIPGETNVNGPILQEILRDPLITIRFIEDPDVSGFNVKPYSLFFSKFDQILLLDADNIPCANPETLFETPEFREKGAVFWPDFWQPSNSPLFDIQPGHLIWELTGLPFVDQFEQESGQLLIDRTRCWPALHVLMFMISVPPSRNKYTHWQHGNKKGRRRGLIDHMDLLYGDKDLFRFAWLLSGTPFLFNPHLPGVVGARFEDHAFCGVTMLQFGLNGEPMFFHRNSRKLHDSGDKWWTHLRRYHGHDPKKNYRIDSFSLGCFKPSPHITDTSLFSYETMEEAGFDDFEERVLQHRHDATQITGHYQCTMLCRFVIFWIACALLIIPRSRRFLSTIIRVVVTWTANAKQTFSLRKTKE